MIIFDKKPEDLFGPEAVKKYKALHQDVWGRLLSVHHCIITLEKLAQFPFHLIIAPSEMTFWTMVRSNAGHVSVALLSGLVNDESPDALTFRRFTKEIMMFEWTNSANKAAYQGALRQHKQKTSPSSVTARIVSIRNTLLAHRLIDRSSGLPSAGAGRINVAELRTLFEEVNRLFDVCSFGAEYVTKNVYENLRSCR